MQIVEKYNRGWIRESQNNMRPSLRLSAPPFDFIYNKITEYSRVYAIDISHDDWDEIFNSNHMLDMTVLLEKLNLDASNENKYVFFSGSKSQLNLDSRDNWIYMRYAKRIYICDLSSEIPFKPSKKYTQDEIIYNKQVARNKLFDTFISQPSANKLSIDGYLKLVIASNNQYNPALPANVDLNLTQRGIELISDILTDNFDKLLKAYGLTFKNNNTNIKEFIQKNLEKAFISINLNTNDFIINGEESIE